jgi:hypothetical protein
MTTIDNNNYELWLLRYAEGELTAVEREAVEAWLADHPEAAEELFLYSEAPRLERDETVRYAAVPQQSTEPLWPALLRWSAAASVVLALMVPALRMGTMGRLEPQEPLVVATAQSTPGTQKTPIIQNTPNIRKTQKKTIVTIDTIETIKTIENIAPEEPLLIALAQEEDTLPLPQEELPAAPTIIPSDGLIVYIPAPDTVYTNTLIVYDDSRPRFRDIASEWVEDTPVAKFIRHNLSPRKAVLIASR